MKLQLVLLMSIILLIGCASRNRVAKAGGPAGQATLIGIIEMVNPEQNYVLIRCEPMPSLEPGAELIGLSATGARSKLILSPERKGHYLTADIKEGDPAVTNLVLVQRGLPLPTAVNPEPAVVPSTAGGPSVFQTLPSLPDVPLSSNSMIVPTVPLDRPSAANTEPIVSPAVVSPAGFGELEPPVGGKP